MLSAFLSVYEVGVANWPYFMYRRSSLPFPSLLTPTAHWPLTLSWLQLATWLYVGSAKTETDYTQSARATKLSPTLLKSLRAHWTCCPSFWILSEKK